MKTSGNTILITGGGSGIGRELALRFNALGNTVIVAGRHMKTLEETIAGQQNMHAMVVDVEDPTSIEAFAERVITEHPNLNVLINNAGIMRREDVSRTRDLSDAEQTVVANLLGPIRLTNALTDHLVNQTDAAIVTVSSVQTELTPGQSTREGYMPLSDYMEEVMTLFSMQPTPKEILVEKVKFLRWAERDGHFDQAVEMLSKM